MPYKQPHKLFRCRNIFIDFLFCFSCVPTGFRAGIVEFVEAAKTLREIQVWYWSFIILEYFGLLFRKESEKINFEYFRWKIDELNVRWLMQGWLELSDQKLWMSGCRNIIRVSSSSTGLSATLPVSLSGLLHQTLKILR